MREYRRWAAPKVSIQFRSKDAKGGYNFKSVKKKGPKPDPASGRYYLRFTDANGNQQRKVLPEHVGYDIAADEAATLAAVLLAQFRGVEVPESDKPGRKTPLADAVTAYITAKSAKAPRTVQAYTLNLESFKESLPAGVGFVEEIDAKTVRHFQDWMLTEQQLAAKTVRNRLLTVADFLKHAGSPVKVQWKEAPKAEENPPRAYADDELQKLFAVMDAQRQAVFKFFLGTGCREQEVQHAEWADVDWQRHTFTVRAKPKWGFTPKNHRTRTVRLPAELVTLLKEHRRKSDLSCSLLFPNTGGRPDGHFLRYLKAAAKRAGLNCGHCISTVDGESHTCASGPYCENFKLHNFRKTYATKLHQRGASLNDLKEWLGHKDLATTQLYLSGSNVHSAHVRTLIDEAFSF
jgi:integrase/recombinase XerD